MSPKTRYILKLALFYSISLILFLPLVEIIGGADFNQILKEKWLNPSWLLISLLVFFPIGLLLGWFNWRQKQKRNLND
jgi:hypothetical protein